MSKKKKVKKTSRTKGRARSAIVLSIVRTDSTFELHDSGAGAGGGVWIGKCIHCGTKLGVTEAGNTAATIEHVVPLCNMGDPTDPRNLALACSSCNSEKGIRHDRYAGRGGRADEVITALQGKRLARWRNL